MAPYIAFGAMITKVVADAATRAADRYGQYNPLIAQQQALAEIRITLGDIRRSREGSKELADYVKAQSILQNQWEDVKLAVMKKIVPVVTGILEVLSALLGIASRTDVQEKDDPTSIILDEKRGLTLPDR